MRSRRSAISFDAWITTAGRIASVTTNRRRLKRLIHPLGINVRSACCSGVSLSRSLGRFRRSLALKRCNNAGAPAEPSRTPDWLAFCFPLGADRRDRFDIDGDGAPVVVAERRGALHDLGHARADKIELRRLS